MSYFKTNYFAGESLAHRAKYGTADSTSDEKGTDNKKNNTSEYNHNYYLKNKEKWEDNDSESGSSKKETESENESSSEKDDNFDVDAAAMDVIRGKYGNGEERKQKLGDDYAIVQKRVNELMKQGAGKAAKEDASEEKKEETKKSGETRSWNEVQRDYYADKYEKDKNKKSSIKHSDLGSILIKDIL